MASSIPLLNPDIDHSAFHSKSCRASAATAAAAFLIIPALIVIFSGALVLTIPHVNAMSRVILPAFLPAAGAILLSLPFIIISIKKREEANEIRERQVDQIKGILESRNFSQYKTEENVEWVEDHLVAKGQNRYYNSEWLKTIKEKADKKDKKDPLNQALDKASENLFKRTKKK